MYGSLGGGNISLVPAPVLAKEPSAVDIKADYELVAQVGTRRAWEVFIGTYKTGFYTELARAQLAKLPLDQGAPPASAAGNTAVASLGTPPPPAPPQPATAEQRAWDAVKDTTDPAALQGFIRRYPNSPNAVTAQQRMDILQRAAQERDDAARADRLAAQKKADDDRKAKAAEADRQKADLLAAQKRADDEQRAKAAEADRLKAEALAAQKRADDAARAQAAADAAQKKADLQAAQKQADDERRAKAAEADRLKAEVQTAQQRADDERRAQAAAAEQKRLQDVAAQQQVACKREQGLIDVVRAAADPAAVIGDARRLQGEMVCDSLRAQVATLVTQLTASAAKNAAAAAAAAAAVRDRVATAQKQLTRIGCYPGATTGQLDDATQAAITRYLTQKGRQTTQTDVTDDFVTELSKQSSHVCPVECPESQVVSGSTCIAAAPPAPATPPPPVSASKSDDKSTRPAQQQQKNKRDDTASKPQQKQQSRQQASSGARMGGASIGVGF